eukprot:6206111-Lingulodinium_polyedra.AAC.1
MSCKPEGRRVGSAGPGAHGAGAPSQEFGGARRRGPGLRMTLPRQRVAWEDVAPGARRAFEAV